MSEPFIGEIKIVAFNYPPRGWAFCNGQLLPISQNQALFSIFGTMYGGNGVTTFALPNLVGRMPIHQGAGYNVGDAGGEAAHTVTQNEMPAHSHPAQARATTTGTGSTPVNSVWATSPGSSFSTGAPDTSMATGVVATAGAGQPHENRAPLLTLNFAVALQGIFPSRN